jgi:hypothetical protein
LVLSVIALTATFGMLGVQQQAVHHSAGMLAEQQQ